MIKVRDSADVSIRAAILVGEVLIVDLLLAATFAVYVTKTGHWPPAFKRVTILLSLTYIMCNLHAGTVLHRRIVRGEQIFQHAMENVLIYMFFSMVILWTIRWPMFTVHYMVPYYLLLTIGIIGFRWIVRECLKLYRSRGGNRRSVIFVGPLDTVNSLFRSVAIDKTTGYRVEGYFNDEEIPQASVYAKYLGTLDDAFDYIEREYRSLDELICTLSTEHNKYINRLLPFCENHFVRFMSIPTNFNYIKRTMSLHTMAGVPVFSLHDEPLSQYSNRVMKRLLDIVVSVVFLCTLFPIIYIVFGIWIKLSSPGPILFRQKRSGLNGKEFWCYKFRSMKVNQDADNVQATRDDPRKTRVGEFMRKTNIDELPQFINVLKGDMSIVGPRPHMLKHTDEYSALIGNYMFRHFVRPGITGYAQITGFRGETHELWQMEGRVEKDIWYIEHWTFLLDLWIMFRTVIKTGDEKAY